MPPEQTPPANRLVGSPELPGGRIIGSAVLIGAGMLLEPELLGGALIGAGVVYGFPLVGQILRPLATTALQIGYSTVASVGGLLGGARDEVQVIVANARAGDERSRGSSQMLEP
ncbi:MAG: hypothetical protein JO166_15970 [Deltaproteobacteria bacterium]|nr:hypothetical protein [Deltaproteobacteria bacterium]